MLDQAVSRSTIRSIIESYLATAKDLMKRGYELTDKLRGAIVAGYTTGMQRARDFMREFMIDTADILRWQRDPDIMHYCNEILNPV